jgi:tryptophan synthase alpha chain
MSETVAVVPYITAGYPTLRESRRLIEACIEAGAAAVEIGIPFSDPLADGPMIQEASQVALRRGMTVAKALRLARGLGARVYFMTYANPVLAYGLRRFFDEADGAGVILPDVVPEEGGEFERAAGRGRIVYLAAPTSPPQRLREIGRRSGDFVYLVSVTGVTGARDRLPPDLPAFVRRVRGFTTKPLYVGFGISSPEHVRQVLRIADGAIVGSALLRVVRDRGVRAAAGWFRDLVRAAGAAS